MFDNSGDSLKQFLQEINEYPLLTPEEEIALGKRIKQGDKEAVDKLIVSNLRLVIKIARKYVGNGIPLIDLIQEGTIGLQTAAERFDVDLGFKFSTYASFWIKQQIMKAIAEDSRPIRIPANVINDMIQLNKLKQRFLIENNREPNFEELQSMTDMDPEKLRDVLEVQQGLISLDQEIPDGDATATMLDFVADTLALDPAEQTKANSKKEVILEVLDSLDEREKDILIKRFGLDDGVQKSLEQVGELVGLTRERVRQLELLALDKLRNPVRANRLAAYR